jgi:hypothetical protein
VVLSLIVALSVVLAGCGAFVPGACGPAGTPACYQPLTAAPGSITQAEAIAAALRVAPASAAEPTVRWASITNNPFTSGPSLVWGVRLEGAFTVAPCPSGFLGLTPTPSDGPCLDRDTGLVVVLDTASGAFLGWTH